MAGWRSHTYAIIIRDSSTSNCCFNSFTRVRSSEDVNQSESAYDMSLWAIAYNREASNQLISPLTKSSRLPQLFFLINSMKISARNAYAWAALTSSFCIFSCRQISSIVRDFRKENRDETISLTLARCCHRNLSRFQSISRQNMKFKVSLVFAWHVVFS